MPFNKIRNKILSLAVMVSLTAGVSFPAYAQFNAFKDPVPLAKTKEADTDLIAVEKEIKGGKVAIGETAHFVVIFTNRSATPVTVKAVNLYPSSTVSAAIALNQCSDIPIAKGSQCAVTVSVTGKQGGSWRVEMLVDHSGQSRVSTASLSGEVERIAETKKTDVKEISVSPAAIDFGTSPGGIPLSKPITFTNNSADSIKIESIGLNVDSQSGFSYRSLCPEVLKPYASCSVILTWDPVAKGKAQGALTVNHTGKAGTSIIEFSGVYAPEEKKVEEVVGTVEFSVKELDFGDSNGGIARSRSVVLSNKTLETIALQSVKLDAAAKSGFTYKSECAEELKPSGSCVVIVSWQPTSAGLAQGVLTIAHSGKTGVADVEVKGTYTPLKQEDVVQAGKEIEIAPQDIDFGASSDDIEKIIPITVTNKSSYKIELWDMVVKASKQSGLSYESQCFEGLMPGESCTVMIKWQPKIKGMSQGAFVMLHSGTSGSENIKIKASYDPLPVSEEKKTEGSVSISPAALDFGTTAGGMAMSRSVVLSNKTVDDIDVATITVSSDKDSGLNYQSQCPAKLKSGSNCVIVVNWTPSVKGIAQGVLTVNHSGKEAVANLEIKGLYEPAAAVAGEEEKVIISPEALDFAATPDDTLMSRSVVLKNKTRNEVAITSIAIDASEQSGFNYKSKCPASLKAGGECVIVVGWKPAVKGAAQGVLTVNHSGKETMANLELKGSYEPVVEEGEEEKIVIAPDALDFGATPDDTLMSRSVVLKNQTKSDVSISAITIDASEQSGFNYKSKCPASLKVGGECVIVVSWKPAVKGAAQGVLTVNHSGKETMANLELKGSYEPVVEEGGEGGVSVSAVSLDFGSMATTTQMSRSIVLSNKTKEAVDISSIDISAAAKSGFTHTSKCPTKLNAGANCTVIVNWTPETEGVAQGVLNIAHSGKELMTNVEIRGSYDPVPAEEGENVGVAISPEALDFGTSDGGMLMSRSVVLKNNTKAEVSISEIAIDASEQSGFGYKSKCPANLKSGGECVIVVNWQPDAEGAAQGVMTVKHSGKQEMANLEIRGIYQPVAVTGDEGSVAIAPEFLDFGTAAGGTLMSRSVILSNKTKADIDIKDISIEASDRAGLEFKSKCPEKLNAGGSCVLVVMWTPTSNGVAQGVLTVKHSGKQSMASLEISGTFTPNAVTSAGIYPSSSPDKGLLVADREVIDFGENIDESSTIVISLVNSGDAELTIYDLALSGLDNGVHLSDKGCAKDSVLKPSSACALTLNWLPRRVGELVDSLQIIHSGARGVLVIPLSGTATGVSQQALELEKKATLGEEVNAFYEDFYYDNVAAKSGELDSPAAIESVIDIEKINKELEPLDEKKARIKAIEVTSLAFDRAVLKSPDGNSMIVRDSEKVVIEGDEWGVAILPTGVILYNEGGEVKLHFDSSLRPISGVGTRTVTPAGTANTNARGAANNNAAPNPEGVVTVPVPNLSTNPSANTTEPRTTPPDILNDAAQILNSR